MRWKQ
jgi:hypothetical protein